jgi:hypothetical protein
MQTNFNLLSAKLLTHSLYLRHRRPFAIFLIFIRPRGYVIQFMIRFLSYHLFQDEVHKNLIGCLFETHINANQGKIDIFGI